MARLNIALLIALAASTIHTTAHQIQGGNSYEISPTDSDPCQAPGVGPAEDSLCAPADDGPLPIEVPSSNEEEPVHLKAKRVKGKSSNSVVSLGATKTSKKGSNKGDVKTQEVKGKSSNKPTTTKAKGLDRASEVKATPTKSKGLLKHTTTKGGGRDKASEVRATPTKSRGLEKTSSKIPKPRTTSWKTLKTKAKRSAAATPN